MNTGEEVLYQAIAEQAKKLTYRRKLRLAQLLIQLARKEEEGAQPEARAATPAIENGLDVAEAFNYVKDRIVKLKPGKKTTVLNSIGAMYQFQGGISEQDKERIFSELVRRKVISVNSNGKITYRA